MILGKEKAFIILVIMLVYSLLICGCGLLGSGKVTNEQMNADIGNQFLQVSEGEPDVWTFKHDTNRCFAIAKSNYTTGKAEITAVVASFRGVGGASRSVATVNGTIALSYKNEGGKWVLEKAENVDLLAKTLTQNDFKNVFLPLQMNLCRNYRHVSY